MATEKAKMKVTLLQTDIAWAKPLDNQRNVETLMAQKPGSDLYVLPEMWSTGFAMEPRGIAERERQELRESSLAWMIGMARKHNAAICGSIATLTDKGEYVNRMYFVQPDGSYDHYDKRHLFGMGGEKSHYSAGCKRVVVHYKGMRFLLLVCYDLRFPVWNRYDGDYDAIIYSANWPTPRVSVWNTLLTARAIENQCYVIGVNRMGKDFSCDYPGESMVVSPYGKPLVKCGDKEETVTAKLDMDKLLSFRTKFPVLDDRDEIGIFAKQK